MKKSYLLLIIGVALAFLLSTSCKKKDTATPPATPTPQPGDLQSMPYTQSFDKDFGTYKRINVLGEQVWNIDYSAATITGHVKIEDQHYYYENEDWLISSPVKIKSSYEHAKVVLNYAAQYQGEANDITLQVSSDYHFGTAPSSGTWTVLPVNIENTDGWTFTDLEASLDQFIGEKIIFAVKFTSSNTASRTIEVKSIKITEGEASGGGGGTGGELQHMPYVQSFASSFGTYCTRSVIGDQVWAIDFSAATMTGHVKVGEEHFYYENEDWLISSPVEITDVEHAKAVVNYAAQYQSDSDDDVTFHVSTSYNWGDDPTTARWTQLDIQYPNTNGWTFTDSEVSLDAFIGQTITVAIKFTSTNTASRTMEVKSISVMEGQAGGGGGTIVGDGSRENPYLASDIILLGIETSDGNKYWVRDYIVGFVDVNYNYIFSTTGAVATNITMSSNMNASAQSEAIPVQLPVGAVRDGLNLADNPGNHQHEVLLYGTLEKYFRVPGVKNVTYAEIDGNAYGTEPGGGLGTFYLNQTLTTTQSFATFIAYSVAGAQVWAQNGSHMDYGAVMSGYDSSTSTSYANEDWLISPAIDLSSSTNPVLMFDHSRGPADQINTGVAEGWYKVFVTNNYTDDEDPNAFEWVELTGVNHTTTAWQWANSGAIAIPDEFKTSSCRIAFRYLSEDDASATWEVKNVIVGE